MNRSWGIFLVLLLSYYTTFAADKSNLVKISSIRIENKVPINIFAERVRIKMEGDYALVNVDYELWNNKEEDLTVEGGMPFMYNVGTVDAPLEWASDYVQGFKAYAEGGKELTAVERTDVSIKNDTVSLKGINTPVRLKTKVYVVSCIVPKLSSKTISIVYRVKNYFKDTKGKSFIPKYGARMLQYDFSNAAKWGEGIIRDFALVIDCGDIPKEYIHTYGVGFTKLEWQDGYFVYNQTDFPVNKHSILHIEYDYNIMQLTNFVNTYQIPMDRVLRIKSSSQEDIYSGPENLLDGNFKTAWAEGVGHQGAGESIEVILDDYPLGAVGILNGFFKEEDDYGDNGKVAKIKVEREYINASNCIQKDETIFTLKQEVFKEIGANNFSEAMIVIADYGSSNFRVRKLKLTIVEATPGTKFNKTCMSELFIMGNE